MLSFTISASADDSQRIAIFLNGQVNPHVLSFKNKPSITFNNDEVSIKANCNEEEYACCSFNRLNKIVFCDSIVLLGDVNGDYCVDEADYYAISQYIMGYKQENFNLNAADVNRDGRINVADYIAVIHIVQEQTIE